MEARRGRGAGSRRDRGALLSRLLFDTTFLIGADRSGDDLDELVHDGDDPALAAVTVAELQVGVLLATGKNRRGRLAFLEDVLAAIAVLAYDMAVAEAHAELLVYVRRQGTPRVAHDLLIAATARSAGRTVVSADNDAFADLPGVDVRTHR